MPNWTGNKLTVTGDAEAVAAFCRAVTDTTENGAVRPLSLNAIDPMPPEYEDSKESWGDSEEFAALTEQFEALSEDEAQVAFFKANQGFAMEMMRRAHGWEAKDGWLYWRAQHWGTKWDLSDNMLVKRSADGTKILFDFDSANGDVAPAIATAARRFPDLTFRLVSEDEFADGKNVRTWREGRELPSKIRPG